MLITVVPWRTLVITRARASANVSRESRESAKSRTRDQFVINVVTRDVRIIAFAHTQGCSVAVFVAFKFNVPSRTRGRLIKMRVTIRESRISLLLEHGNNLR